MDTLLACVLASCFMASSNYREMLLHLPVIGTSREVVAADVRRFRVTTHADAVRQLQFAREHERSMDTEVKTYNSPAKYWRWKAECEWRQECWQKLAWALDDDVLYYGRINTPQPSNTVASRVMALESLRELLGDDAFWLGQMPLPIPSYRLSER